MTLSGLSRFNVENALAAASAALAAGIDRKHVIAGLRSFRPDAEHNPGRMNFFTMGEVSVVMDLAHNEAGLEAMIEIMRGVRAPGRRLLLGLGAVGDRQDDLLEMLGEIAARDADVVAIGHKEKYLRGRTIDEIEGCCAPEPSASASPTSRPTRPSSTRSRRCSSSPSPATWSG